MLSIQCKSCGKELTSSSKFQSCGCSNMASIIGESVTAIDLSKVVVTNNKMSHDTGQLSSGDLQYQEARRKRKVRKLDFEER